MSYSSVCLQDTVVSSLEIYRHVNGLSKRSRKSSRNVPQVFEIFNYVVSKFASYRSVSCSLNCVYLHTFDKYRPILPAIPPPPPSSLATCRLCRATMSRSPCLLNEAGACYRFRCSVILKNKFAVTLREPNTKTLTKCQLIKIT